MANGILKPGSVVGGYRVKELLHTGGMAQLWTVTPEHNDTEYLMKVPVLHEG